MDYPPEGTVASAGTRDELGFALKIIIYMLVGAVFFLASFVAYLYVFFLPLAPEISSHEFTDAKFATVYSEPIPAFNITEETVTMTDVAGGSLGINIEDDVIYSFGYISTDGVKWTRVVLKPGKGSVVSSEENWMTNNANYELFMEADEFNITNYPYTAVGYIALYSCSRGTIGQWDCHDGWQLKPFGTVIIKDRTAQKDTCGCGEGFVCVQDRCVREESIYNKAKVKAGESLSVTIRGKEYLATLISIGGNGQTAKMYLNGETIYVDEPANDIYFVKDDFRFLIDRIEPFTSDEDGYIEIIVVSDYEGMSVCENCVYKPPTTGIVSGGGGSSSGGSSVSSCTPDCYGRQCGPDGCGDTCGSCPDGYECEDYQCVGEECTPDCINPATEQPYECGDDGCGGSCPPGCDVGESCYNGVCISGTTCSDGLWNGDETGIDCGGSCPNQDCCNNGYMDTNLGETGTDCGGTCHSGTTYYVSNSLGDDSNNGTQTYSPWKTISKVNSVQFEPGDSILFKRGDTWREKLTVPSSGSEGEHITFSAYGTGEKPRILGSEQVIGWTETFSGSHIWNSSTLFMDIYSANPRAEIFFEHSRGNASWGNHQTDISGLIKEYDWTWLQNHTYVYSPENPSTRYNSVEVPQRDNVVDMNNKEYITFDGLSLYYSKSGGIKEYYRGYWNSNLTQRSLDLHGYVLRNSEIAYLARQDDYGYGSYVVYSDSLIENNVIHDVGRRGICLYVYGLADVSNITVQNNTLYNGFHTTGVDIAAGSEDHTSGNLDQVIVRNNLIYDDPYKELVGGGGDGYLTSELNFISGTPPYGNVTGVYFYNNVLMYPSGAAMHFENVAESYVYNNIFYGFNKLKTSNNFHLDYDTYSKNITVKNNIFYGDADYDIDTTAILFYLGSHMDYADVDANHNLYYHEDPRLRIVQDYSIDWNTGTFWMDTSWMPRGFAEMQAAFGWEQDSPLPADPLFADQEHEDFRLQETSPTVDAGTIIPGFHCDTPGEHPGDDCTEWYGMAPDIGAVESPYTSDQSVESYECARSFYVSNSGDDSKDGLTGATAWRTIAHVNGQSFDPGDCILFNSGDVWYESISVGDSGDAGGAITYGAYGSGDKPMISGFTIIDSWNDEGNGIYSAVISPESSPDVARLDGEVVAMGRYPNEGYLYIDECTAATLLVDYDIPSVPDWTGAEVVARKNDWVLDRSLVVSHDGDSLILTPYVSNNYLTPGNGYFIQNSIHALDVLGEWAYDNETSTFYIFFGSDSPASHDVEVSVLDEGLLAHWLRNNITVRDLSFTGFNGAAIHIASYCEDAKILDNIIDASGEDGILVEGYSHDPFIDGNVISNSPEHAIWVTSSNERAIITNNEIENTGAIPGSYHAWGARGISSYSHGALIQYNNVKNSGYNGMQISGSNVVVRNNFIDTFALWANDAGGFYTQDLDAGWTMLFDSNIVVNGIGEIAATTDDRDLVSAGLYLDSTSSDITIVNNTIAYCLFSGLKLSHTRDVIVEDNVIFDNYNAVEFLAGESGWQHEVETTDVQNNIFFAKEPDQSALFYVSGTETVDSMGDVDYNYYVRPINNESIMKLAVAPWNPYYWPGVAASFEYWKTFSGQDAHSSTTPVTITSTDDILFEYNPTKTEKEVTLDGDYIDAKGNHYSGTITIPPYRSVVLIRQA